MNVTIGWRHVDAAAGSRVVWALVALLNVSIIPSSAINRRVSGRTLVLQHHIRLIYSITVFQSPADVILPTSHP
jgi:hypothetical protein